jgi:hypothetical protein
MFQRKNLPIREWYTKLIYRVIVTPTNDITMGKLMATFHGKNFLRTIILQTFLSVNIAKVYSNNCLFQQIKHHKEYSKKIRNIFTRTGVIVACLCINVTSGTVVSIWCWICAVYFVSTISVS